MPRIGEPQHFQLLLDDAPELEIEKYVNLLQTHFKIESLQLIVVSKRKSEPLSNEESLLYFTPAELSGLGNFANEALKKQLMKPSDICVDLRKNHSLLGDFLFAVLPSRFKVNFDQYDKADLNLKLDKATDLDAKFAQLKKYLIQLNGI